MTIHEFTKALFDEAQLPKRMTIETATEDIRNFRLDGWELPDDITPESYRDEWNSFLPDTENKGKLQVFSDIEFHWSATLRYKPHGLLGDYVLRIYTESGYMVYIGRFSSAFLAKEYLLSYDDGMHWYTTRGYVK